jgi:hypothetical protein
MRTIGMPFVRMLRTISWPHAAGELLLIVIGVLLALALNNWNQTRQERQIELAILQELRASLAADLVRLNEAVQERHDREQRVEALIQHLDRRLPYADALATKFGAVLGFSILTPNRSPYEVLKARGLGAISSAALRIRLVRLYDQTFADLEGSQQDDRNVILEVVRPYFLKSFRGIRFRESATPLNYNDIATDQYFRNVVEYRLTSLRSNEIEPVTAAVTDVAEVIEILDHEIERLK